jgi:hypothetical protein
MIQVERSTLAEYPRMTRPALGAPLPSEPCAHPCGEGSAAARFTGGQLALERAANSNLEYPSSFP